VKLKIIAVFILTIIIMNIAIILIPENNVVKAESTKINTQKIANLILFVEFQDTNHAQHNTKCFINNESTTFQYFNGEGGYEKGLKTYVNKISYGQLEVENIFPQYNGTTKKIISYKANKNREYYQTNINELIEEMAVDVNSNGTIKDDQILDYNNDRNIDNLTLVLASGDNINENSYKATYQGTASIKGKFVNSYNVLHEGLVYGTLQNSGVIIHEFLHTLDYPDLYRGGVNDGVPVGPWDIMASVNTFVQYPLAYFRSNITNWFTIPTVSESKQNYTLYAASKTTYETRNQQAVIIKTPYSDTEFFVVEYRKKENNSNSYDSHIPGSGLIIYRINLESVTNMKGDSSEPYNPDVAYVFRPEDTFDENGHERGKGDIFKSFISAESQTKSYGSRNFTDSLTDGAITYSDGQNSGIIIENVGSSAGNQITFDITILDMPNTNFWKNVTAKYDEKMSFVDSYIDTDGSIYYLTKNLNNKIQLYRYNENKWSKIGNEINEKGTEHTLLKFNNEFYVVYNLEVSNGNYNTKLLKLKNNNWQEVYKFTELNSGNYVAVDADETGIYFAIPNSNCSKLQGYKYNNTITNLGEIATSNYLSNTYMTVENGNVAVLYREFMNNNKINVKLYKNNTWNNLETSMNANSAKIKLNNNKIYLLRNGETYGKDGGYVYTYDINKQDGWKKFGDNTFSDKNISEMDICFQGNYPYIVYQEADDTQINVKHVKINEWEKWAQTVANTKANNIQAHTYKNKIYVTYITQATQVIYTKSNETSNIVEGEKQPNIFYKTHVQDIGWQNYVKNGEMSGTSGKGLRLEGISMYIDSEYYGDVLYRTHIQNIGWEGTWARFGGLSGTQGKSLRLEGIQIKLQGEIANYYDIYYRVHIQDFGWLGWAKNGESSGSEGFSKRLEGIEVKLVKKGEPAPGNTKNPFIQKQVIYQTHVQQEGWQNFVCDGEVSGTSGKSLRLEGIKIQLDNMKYNGGIEYKTHIQNIGWETSWKSNGAMSGTSGRSLRLEAIKIKLTGEIANYYDIYYRVHVQNFGWLGWAKNGEPSGSAGFSYRLEGIQIKLVEKGESPPVGIGESYKEKKF